MTTPKKTKFRAIFKLEEAIGQMFVAGFLEHEIKDIIREILKKWKQDLSRG